MPQSLRFCPFFFVIAFTPSDVNLFRFSPSERRRFFDRTFSFISSDYFLEVQRLKQVLEQKNALLKHKDLSQISYWNQILAQITMNICKFRQEYIEKLNLKLTLLFQKMTLRHEKLSLKYLPCLAKETLSCEKAIFEKLEKQKQREKDYGYSCFGAHRDDFKLFLDEKGDKEFFSQGEMKITTLALKIAINDLISESCQTNSILIFDDLFSEFDRSVCNQIMQFFADIPNQIFITSTNFPDQFKNEGQHLAIRQGVVHHD